MADAHVASQENPERNMSAEMRELKAALRRRLRSESGKFSDAERVAASTQITDRNLLSGRCAVQLIGEIHEEKGGFPQAIEMFCKAAIGNGMKPAKAADRSDALRGALMAGPRGYWRKKLELADVRSNFGGDLYYIAVIYMHLGEKDSAFEFLDKVEAQKSDFAFRINFDRRFDGVRSDPRFKALLRKLGLEKWSGTTYRTGAETR